MELKELKVGTMYYCKTKEEVLELFNKLDKLGYKWINGNSLLSDEYRLENFKFFVIDEGKCIATSTEEYTYKNMFNVVEYVLDRDCEKKLPKQKSLIEQLVETNVIYITDGGIVISVPDELIERYKVMDMAELGATLLSSATINQLRQIEFDMIKAMEIDGSSNAFNEFKVFQRMVERGHFKGVQGHQSVNYIMNNHIIIDEDDYWQ